MPKCRKSHRIRYIVSGKNEAEEINDRSAETQFKKCKGHQNDEETRPARSLSLSASEDTHSAQTLAIPAGNTEVFSTSTITAARSAWYHISNVDKRRVKRISIYNRSKRLKKQQFSKHHHVYDCIGNISKEIAHVSPNEIKWQNYICQPIQSTSASTNPNRTRNNPLLTIKIVILTIFQLTINFVLTRFCVVIEHIVTSLEIIFCGLISFLLKFSLFQYLIVSS